MTALCSAFVLALLFVLPGVAANETSMPPSAPWGLMAVSFFEAVAQETRVMLAWQAPLDDAGAPITEYRVYRADVPGGGMLVGSSASTQFTDSPAPATASYYVTAVNAAGESSSSNASRTTINGGSCIDITIGVPPGVVIDWGCLGLRCPHPSICIRPLPG